VVGLLLNSLSTIWHFENYKLLPKAFFPIFFFSIDSKCLLSPSIMNDQASLLTKVVPNKKNSHFFPDSISTIKTPSNIPCAILLNVSPLIFSVWEAKSANALLKSNSKTACLATEPTSMSHSLAKALSCTMISLVRTATKTWPLEDNTMTTKTSNFQKRAAQLVRQTVSSSNKVTWMTEKTKD
jgi:hypothetical protein